MKYLLFKMFALVLFITSFCLYAMEEHHNKLAAAKSTLPRKEEIESIIADSTQLDALRRFSMYTFINPDQKINIVDGDKVQFVPRDFPYIVDHIKNDLIFIYPPIKFDGLINGYSADYQWPSAPIQRDLYACNNGKEVFYYGLLEKIKQTLVFLSFGMTQEALNCFYKDALDENASNEKQVLNFGLNLVLIKDNLDTTKSIHCQDIELPEDWFQYKEKSICPNLYVILLAKGLYVLKTLNAANQPNVPIEAIYVETPGFDAAEDQKDESS